MDDADLGAVFQLQRETSRIEPFPDLFSRRDRLKRLREMIKDNADAITQAVNQDFGNRSTHESQLVEVVGSIEAIDYVNHHLREWMKPRRRSTSIWFLPGSNRIEPQPVGVVGVMSPWNYPVNLAVAPMASAIGAGNRVMVRLSEYTPATTLLFCGLVSQYFDPNEVVSFGGDANLAKQFSQLPFDHLLFTGSTEVGRHIMAAAAPNLTPVTLELGGKSPVIVADDFSPEEAGERVAWGKCFNAGQTCVAPDYAFVARHSVRAFSDSCLNYFEERYANGASDSYTSVVADRFQQRIEELVEEAQAQGAEIRRSECAQIPPTNKRKYPLTLVIDPPADCRIMQEEIFGPVLVVLSYDSVEDTLAHIKSGDRPLALYLFSHDRSLTRKVLRETHSGSVAVNDVMLQYLQVDLPFGGVGTSGFGRYHGREGFETFSHLKPIFRQKGLGNFTGLKTLYPPYNQLANTMIKAMGG